MKKVTLAEALNEKSRVIGRNKALAELMGRINTYNVDPGLKDSNKIEPFLTEYKENAEKLILIKQAIARANAETGVNDLVIKKSEYASLISVLGSVFGPSRYMRSEAPTESQIDEVELLSIKTEYQKKCDEIQSQINKINGSTSVEIPS